MNIDFTRDNFRFNARTSALIYNKDLSNCTFNNIPLIFDSLSDFHSVNICGTKFNYDFSNKFDELSFLNKLSYANYDSNTLFNGISLDSYYNSDDKQYSLKNLYNKN